VPHISVYHLLLYLSLCISSPRICLNTRIVADCCAHAFICLCLLLFTHFFAHYFFTFLLPQSLHYHYHGLRCKLFLKMLNTIHGCNTALFLHSKSCSRFRISPRRSTQIHFLTKMMRSCLSGLFQGTIFYISLATHLSRLVQHQRR